MPEVLINARAAARRQMSGVERWAIELAERLPAVRDLASDLGVNMHTVLRAYRVLRDEGLIELHPGRGAVVVVRIGGHAALAGAIHDLVDEAKLHDLPESALLALISEAYRWSPTSPGVLRSGQRR